MFLILDTLLYRGMQSIYASVLPYIAVNLIVIGLVLAWPDLVLFLPRNLR